MTASGHYLTALSLGVVGSVAIVSPEYGNQLSLVWGDLIRWAADVSVNGINYAPVCAVALCYFIGCAAGAWAPDWLEITFFCRRYRLSLIPHRTLTHTVAIWLIILAFVYWQVHEAASAWHYLLCWIAMGFASAGVLHVLIDMLSPVGVPLLKPFGSRYSLRVYRTGELSEWKVIVGVMLLGIGYLAYL